MLDQGRAIGLVKLIHGVEIAREVMQSLLLESIGRDWSCRGTGIERVGRFTKWRRLEAVRRALVATFCVVGPFLPAETMTTPRDKISDILRGYATTGRGSRPKRVLESCPYWQQKHGGFVSQGCSTQTRPEVLGSKPSRYGG